MENKGTRKKIQSDNTNNLSCIEKIIKYQEILYNVIYKDGKWLRRRKCPNKNK